MKILVLIMSHLTDDSVFVNHKKIWEKVIYKSQDKNLPIDYLFLYSDDTIGTNFIVKKNELISNCVENYWDSLLIKTINGFDFFLKSDYDLVFKTNLSTIINLDKFYNVCNNIDTTTRNFIYDGFVGLYDDYKFTSGAGMLLNKNSVNLILQHKNEISEQWTDDIFFGYILNKKYNIQPLYDELLRYDVINQNQSVNESLIKQSTHIRIKIRKDNQDIIYTNQIYNILYN
jgi:hypothetical protein